MIFLTNDVPPVYIEESRDFQYFLRAYDVIMNMVKQDIDTLQYLANTEECQSRIMPLLKTKLGFFTNYPINNEMLRTILESFPIMVRNKGSLKAIQQAVYTFLKALNIKAEILIKFTGNEKETVKGGIEIDDHTILIAINSAVQNFYILEEIFKYILPAGYQYTFYFYREMIKDSWLLNENTGKFLVVSNLISDSIRTENFYNQDFDYSYMDPQVDGLLNNVNTTGIFTGTDNIKEYNVNDFSLVKLKAGFKPYNFESTYFFFYKKSNGKYVQLTSTDTWQDNTYYIPILNFITQEDNYELMYEEPMMGDNVSRFEQQFFNYYIKEGNTFKNLTEPVQWEAGKYFKNTREDERVIIIAPDVISYSAIPITSEYIATATAIAQ